MYFNSMLFALFMKYWIMYYKIYRVMMDKDIGKCNYKVMYVYFVINYKNCYISK